MIESNGALIAGLSVTFGIGGIAIIALILSVKFGGFGAGLGGAGLGGAGLGGAAVATGGSAAAAGVQGIKEIQTFGMGNFDVLGGA